jgi:hypothetical protein
MCFSATASFTASAALTGIGVAHVIHGEPDAADTLRGRINRELGWHARVPEHLERIDLAQPR